MTNKCNIIGILILLVGVLLFVAGTRILIASGHFGGSVGQLYERVIYADNTGLTPDMLGKFKAGFKAFDDEVIALQRIEAQCAVLAGFAGFLSLVAGVSIIRGSSRVGRIDPKLP